MDLVKRYLVLLLIFFGLVSTLVAGNPRIELDILNHADTDRKATNSDNYGKGKVESEKVIFRLKAINRDFSPYEGLTVVAYIYGVDAFAKRVQDRKYTVKTKLTCKPFDLAYNQTMELPLGEAEFSYGTSAKDKGAVVEIYYGGDKYAGWAAELQQDGDVIGTYFSGSKSKKAYRSGVR